MHAQHTTVVDPRVDHIDRIADRQHTLAGQLRAVDPTRPPWVRVPVAGVGGPDKQPGAEALAANLARQCGVISG